MDTSSVNLLTLISRDTKLKKVSGTGGGEYHGPCPFCGGKDRFRVQPNRRGGGLWACRQCGQHGDAIAYVQAVQHVDFATACNNLGIGRSGPTVERRRHIPQSKATLEQPPSHSSVKAEIPALTDPAYSDAALDFVIEAAGTLFSPDGEKARAWLNARGLPDAILKHFAIGYNAADSRAAWGSTEVFLPRGVVIPWHIAGQLWRVNFRRPSGAPKYISAAGGTSNALYLADTFRPGCTAVLVEGEFDALLLRRLCPDLINAGLRPFATGSTTGARALRWITRLGLAERVLVAYDTDKPGQDAARWWLDNLPNARRLEPTAHDITDMYKAGQDIRGWIVQAAPDLNRKAVEFLHNYHPAPDAVQVHQQVHTTCVPTAETVPAIWADRPAFYELIRPNIFTRGA